MVLNYKVIGSRETCEIPEIRIDWKRGWEKIDWNKAKHHLCVGQRDSGKSALGETIAMHYPQIIDIYGSSDQEGLAWCRSPIEEILLVVGDNCDLNASWNVTKIGDLTFTEMNSYECVLTVPGFYSTDHELWNALETFTGLFKKRIRFNNPSFLLIREASNFLYSRIGTKGDTGKDAKREFIRFQREMRHFGYSLFVDSIRWTSIDREMRDLADYTYLKDLSYVGVSKDISFIYKYVHPRSFAGLGPQYFAILTSKANIGLGDFDYPQFHKIPGEDLMQQFDIRPEFGDVIELSDSQTVGDAEHAEMMKLYIEDELSMQRVAAIVNRSSGTVMGHINRHNMGIARKKVCMKCKRVNSGFETTWIDKKRR